MIKLSTKFTDDEQKTLSLWNGDELKVLYETEKKCFVQYDKGKLFYYQCFSRGNDSWDYTKFEQVQPNRMIKFSSYYIMEPTNQLGSWFIGIYEENNSIMFLAYCDTLEDAFDSL